MKETWCALSFVYTESTAALHRALVIIIIIIMVTIVMVIIIIVSMVFLNFSLFQFSFQFCPNFSHFVW